MTPKLNAYTVALVFEGQIAMHVIVAGSEAEAVAQTTAAAAREIQAPLIGVGVAPLDPEMLRSILRTIEGGGRPKPTVVPLRSDNLRQQWPPTSAQIADDQHEFAREQRSDFGQCQCGGPLTIGGICRRCSRALYGEQLEQLRRGVSPSWSLPVPQLDVVPHVVTQCERHLGMLKVNGVCPACDEETEPAA